MGLLVEVVSHFSHQRIKGWYGESLALGKLRHTAYPLTPLSTPSVVLLILTTANMADRTTFHATCHCKASKLSFTVPTSSLPLPTHFCHCSICRKTHGSLCIIHSSIPEPHVNLESFTAYASSLNLIRYFCSTCGAHVFNVSEKGKKDESWYVSTSLVDADEKTWDFSYHIWIEGTGDGGLATWLPHVGQKKLRMWKEQETDDPQYQETGDWNPTSVHSTTSATETTTNDEKLKASCHCGGISFYISRPSGDEELMQLPSSLRPKDNRKWLGSTEVCNSCRLVCGTGIISWVFPLLSHCTLADGIPYTPGSQTAKTYSSSKGITRTFCGTCGAMATYGCDDRLHVVDVAVGLLEGSGARAEDWVEWRRDRVGWKEDCGLKGLVQGLEEGMMMTGGEGG
jgi:hypothetical protein